MLPNLTVKPTVPVMMVKKLGVWCHLAAYALISRSLIWLHWLDSEACMQEIPSLDIPLHTLIELQPKPDGQMAEEHIVFDVKAKEHHQVCTLVPSAPTTCAPGILYVYTFLHSFSGTCMIV